ncbi:hypothetical protein FLONG3_115 [Fusarium longipes]|uniref:Uncharacterized protein n=1 Tax=Fusarium longipes TaxID=694270 RepID=A0A395TAH1_9HYPO|nr:hypothetical protein FLONG3_115 [Fusarium longipes]
MAVAAPDTVSEALAACLARAIDVYHAVLRLHNSQGHTGDTSLVRLFETLALSVQCVKDLDSVPDALGSIKFACVQIADDLIVHFQRLTVAENGLIDAAKVCGVWGQDDLSALGGRLKHVLGLCQDVLPTLHVDVSLSGLAGLQLNDQSEVISHKSTEKAIEHTQSEVQSPQDVGDVPTKKPPRLAPAGLVSDFILESLAYKSMHDRESQVTEAHAKTLDWIFDKSAIDQSLRQNFRDSFVTWLNDSALGPIYWITGKPGSGKSTLVRYLSQHPVALHHLRKWAGNKTISTAGFFFWTSGSRQQRSQTGLLRYLLHQLLSSDQDLVEKAFPSLWTQLRQMTTKERVNFALDWTVEDLQTAFHSLLEAALPKTKICLFIDGLDEFEGDHVQIIEFFQGLTTKHEGDSLKLCLSSRPWDVFQKAFGSSVPNTKLQDLSYEDMYQYAHDTLRADAQLRRLFKSDQSSAHSILTSVVEQADGVFLWVRLAVERMLAASQRVKNGDFDILKITLQSLPTELDDLFEKLLFTDQTSSEIIQTATLYQLMHAREIVADFIKDESSNSLTVWELAFALFEDDDLALSREVVEATDEEIQSRCGTTMKYIKERFSGLLNVHITKPAGNMRFAGKRQSIAGLLTTSKVIYIHRTVRDWLVETGASRLSSFQTLHFDPHLRLLRSYVLRLKHPLEEIEHHRRLDEWYPDIALAMTHARYIINDEGLGRKFLNEMDKTISWLWLTKKTDETDHWAKNTFGAYEIRMKAPPIHRPFLCLAIKFGLTKYVCEEVADINLDQADTTQENDGSTPLLSYATEFLCSRNKTIFPMSSPALVQWLLSHPSPINPGPNHEYKHFETHQPLTPWITVLRHLRDAKRRGWIEYYDIDPEGTARWAEIVRELVNYADLEAVVPKDIWDPEITALGVVEMLVDTYGSAEIERILVAMKERMG